MNLLKSIERKILLTEKTDGLQQGYGFHDKKQDYIDRTLQTSFRFNGSINTRVAEPFVSPNYDNKNQTLNGEDISLKRVNEDDEFLFDSNGRSIHRLMDGQNISDERIKRHIYVIEEKMHLLKTLGEITPENKEVAQRLINDINTEMMFISDKNKELNADRELKYGIKEGNQSQTEGNDDAISQTLDDYVDTMKRYKELKAQNEAIRLKNYESLIEYNYNYAILGIIGIGALLGFRNYFF